MAISSESWDSDARVVESSSGCRVYVSRYATNSHMGCRLPCYHGNHLRRFHHVERCTSSSRTRGYSSKCHLTDAECVFVGQQPNEAQHHQPLTPSVVRRMLETGYDVNAIDADGLTALCHVMSTSLFVREVINNQVRLQQHVHSCKPENTYAQSLIVVRA